MANPIRPSMLVLGNPFADRTAIVDESFLKNQGFELGKMHGTENVSEVDASWAAAKKLGFEGNETFSLGGTGTNVLKVLARLKRECRIHGKGGNDEFGEEALRRLQKLGIKTLLSKSDQPIGKVNCFISEGGERTMHTFVGAAGSFSKEDIDESFFKGASHVHLEGYAVYSPGSLEKSIDCASQEGACISIDLSSPSVIANHKENFLNILDKIHIIFGNLKEFETLKESSDIDEIIKKFSQKQLVVITNSEKGCWVKEWGQEKAVHYPALQIPKEKVVATTGAGDFFAGGFLNGMMLGLPVKYCVEMGHLAASKVIQVAEAELSENGWEELRQEIEKITQIAECVNQRSFECVSS